MKNFISIFLSITLLSFLSCGKSTENTEDVDSTALTIAVLPTYDCIPFYYADSLGIFDSLGVSVRFITYKSSMDADTAFVNGIVHGAITDIVKASIWRSNGDSVKIVMAMDPNLSLVTAKNARLFQTNSLKERIIAITRHSILDFTTDKILESVKMQSEELNKPQINDILLRTQMTNQNQYDGAILPEPYASEATLVWGAKQLATSSSLGLHYMGALVFNDSVITSRREDIENVIKGYQIAVNQLNANKQYPLEYISKKLSAEIPDTLFEYKRIPDASLPSDSLLQKVNTWISGRKLVKNTTNYKSLVDSTFIHK